MTRDREVFISVDVETAGPIPGEYSLLSIGACNVDDPARTFDCELKPLTRNAVPKALEVTGLSLDELEQRGLAPQEAMQRFDSWLRGEAGNEDTLIFVALNAPFDWSFVNYYFHRFLGRNPFGFTALDIKAYYMGVTGCRWDETRSSRMAGVLKPQHSGNHQALHDAQYQAELFRLTRAQARS
jgi:DNA polymerase III epsilon subunit-like protein